MLMYPNIPITKPIHPKFIIQHLVASTVRELYKVKWQPRVVLQKQREIEDSSLSSIDYAVPCFELSQLVDASPIELSREIASHLATRLTDTSDTDYHKEIETESVSGYVNFRLKEPLINRVINSSMQWYKNPTHLAPENQLNLHILGSSEGGSGAMRAAELLYDVGHVLGVDVRCTRIVSDASAKYITDLASQHSNTPQESAEYKRRLKSAVAHDLDVRAAFQSIANHRDEEQSSADGTFGAAVQNVSQQSAAPDVHVFLDEKLAAMTEVHDAFIFDEANRAVYYSRDHDVVALRSAEGFLYEHAYMLHYLHSLQLTDTSADRIVLFAPHQEHRLITAFLSILYGDDMRVALFDPAVSKLDIAEFVAHAQSVDGVLVAAQQYLRDFNVVDIDSSPDRYNVLQVADFSVDALMALEAVNMPSFFDTLNQLAQLTQQES